MKKLLPYLLCFSPLFQATAQNFGGHPPGLNWQQINTPNVRVIFPEGMEPQAQRTANIINYLHENNLRSVGERTKKVDLVIQNRTVIPNGFVTVAPFRSEFFATPPQDPSLLGSLDWIDVLAVHEYRHVLQYTNANRGLTYIFYFLFGELGWGGGASFSIPSWYWEGDAVVAETALTGAGRGRLPAFSLEQRALLLNNRRYSYMKARNGSWKDIMPSHYPLGYALCNYGRENFGNDIWKDVFHDAASYKTIFYPFSGALRKHSGLRTPKLYQQTYEALENQWKEEQEKLTLTGFTQVNKPGREVTSYNFPHYLSDGKVVCVKEGFDKISTLAAISPDGKEQRLTTQGIVQDNYISESNDKIAWSEVESHLRWGNVYYSALVTYDYKTGKKRKLNSKGQYFSPAYSHSGDKIAAVNITPDQQNTIHILDALTGDVLQKLPNPDNHFLMYPQWTADDKALVFIDKHNSKMALVRYDFGEGSSLPLMDYTSHIINTPRVAGNRIFFSASFSGIDNIYTVTMGEREIYQITSAKLGAYQPGISSDGKTLFYSNFTDTGYDLVKMSVEPSAWNKVTPKEPVEMYATTAIENEGGDILNDIPAVQHEVGNYRPTLSGLRLHSWYFAGPDINSPGLTGLFDNVLGNSTLSLSLGINPNEQKPSVAAHFKYGELFPVLNLDVAYSDRSADFINPENKLESLDFTEARLGGGISMPLQWFHGAYFSGLELSALAYYRDINKFRKDTVTTTRPPVNFGSWELGLSFHNLRKRAPQHIYSRFGQVIRANYEQGINKDNIGRIRLEARIYLPGILSNHSIELEAGYQEEKLSNPYQYGDLFEYARGYSAPVNDKVWRLGANYHFPLVYLDWGFGGLLYFRRIRGNIFYDQSQYWHQNTSRDRRSYGGELIFDTQFFSLPLIAAWGLRLSRLLDAGAGKEWNFGVFVATEL